MPGQKNLFFLLFFFFLIFLNQQEIVCQGKESILQEIFHSNHEIREKAIHSLSAYDAKEIFSLLSPYCEDKSPDIRCYAIAALDSLDTCESYAKIASMLEDRNPSVAYRASQALSKNIPRSKDYLLSALKSNNIQSQYYALVAVEKGKDISFWDCVVFLSDSSSPQIRRQAIITLGSYSWEKTDKRFSLSVGILQKKLLDSDRLVRASAIWGLGQYDYEDKIKNIQYAARDDSWEVRCAALNALPKKEREENLCHFLLPLFHDSHWAVRYAAVKQAGKLSCSSLLEKLHLMLLESQEKEKVKAAICSALGEIAHPSSLPFLLQVWQSSSFVACQEADYALTTFAYLYPAQFLQIFRDKKRDLKLRCDCALLLGRVKAKSISPYLYGIAKDTQEKEEIRFQAIVLLSDFEGQKAIPLFREFLAQTSPYLQEAALLALGKMQDEEKLPEIFGFLSSPNTRLKETALWCISQFEFEKTKPFILQALKSKEANVSKAALLLIKHLGKEKEISTE
ncbi:MAG: HEAT repeat domain-containing protein [Candidatus Brocadiae bacterium]|nr:HEAT repeat domain-containing protein [Candidatus Brocadiia bacterium]